MDKPISDSQRLLSLDKQQALIVYLIRHGSTNREIGRVLGGDDPKDALASTTISDYMRPIYKKLDIQIEKLSEKRNEITNRYGKLIDIYIPDESLLENWVAIPLPFDLDEEEITPTDADEDLTTDIGVTPTDIGEAQTDTVDEEIEPPEEEEEKLAGEQTTTPQEESQSTEQQPDSILGQLDQIGGRQGIDQRPPAPRPPRWVIVGVPLLILCIICMFVILVAGFFARPLFGTVMNQIRETQPPANTQEPPITQDVLLNPTTPTPLQVTESQTEGGQVIPTDTLTPTEIPTLTNTPEPSLTPTLEPTPVPLLFEDTFEEGLSDEWSIVYGGVDIVDGNLVAREDTMMMVGSEDWSNYHIRTEVSSPECWFVHGMSAIGFLAQDFDNMIAFGWSDCQRALFEVIDGEWEGIPGTSRQRSGGVSFETLDIMMEGKSVTVYDNNEKLVSFIADMDKGMVALRLDDDTQVKFFTVEQLP